MAGKEIIVAADEFAAILNPTENARQVYEWARQYAGLEMTEEQKADFVAARNAKSGWRDLWEFKANLEMVVGAIETVVKHSMNASKEGDLPAGFSWKGGGNVYSIADGAAPIIIDTLLRKNKMLKKDDFFNALDASKIAKVAGIKAEKLQELFPDTISSKPKASSLMVK